MDYEVDKEVDKKNICKLLRTDIFTMLYLPHRFLSLARTADEAPAALRTRILTSDLLPDTLGQWRPRVLATIDGLAG
ncbi:hypothetical protein [Kutzneria sp. CA-103260]|uniref:hypothetical protein n=1 Tax=Kutzneria sp. CA-103260 TaxID=2802641 RepID=UPI001BAC0272|nr:hypothetical protein [Kutzneria sp. CA-103260]